MCRDKTETAQTFNTFTYFGEVVSLEKPTQTKCTHLNFRLPWNIFEDILINVAQEVISQIPSMHLNGILQRSRAPVVLQIASDYSSCGLRNILLYESASLHCQYHSFSSRWKCAHTFFFTLNEKGLWNGCIKSTQIKNADFFFFIVKNLVFYGCFGFVLLKCRRNIQFMNMYSQLLSLGD